MRNVLTAGEHNKRFVDHFPVSRASRWRGNHGDMTDVLSTDLNPITSIYGNPDEIRAKKLIDGRNDDFEYLLRNN